MNAIPSVVLYLRFCHSPSLPSLPPPSVGVELPQLLQLLHGYLETPTGENDASSCVGCTMVHSLPPTIGTNLYVDGVIFFYCAISVYLRMTSQS